MDEVVNKATALWARSKSDLTDEEYQEFYHHVSHDFSDALLWSHNKVEGKLEYTSLLYVPAKAPFDLYNRDVPRGLKLYVQRVFIMDDAEQFLPLYLRFMKGVIDTNDLDLNVSREILQDNAAVSSIRSALTKRVLDMLSKLAKKEPEKYLGFWKEFGDVLKEAVAEDYANRDKVAKLYRFASTHNSDDQQSVGLEDYIGRMQDGQDKIYYTTAENYASAISSPHLELFRKKGIEVLLLNGRIDEWMMSHLFEFEGKSFQHIAKGELDQVLSEEESKDHEEKAKQAESLTERIHEVLSDQVDAVKVTHRLTQSPACLVLNAHEMGAQMRQIMEAAGQPLPETKPSFEINPDHELIKQLDREQDEDRFKDLALVLFDQACLADGHPLKDANSYVKRVNRLLLGLA